MTGIVRNVTQQKLAAEELAKVYDREKRARDEAVEANRSKDFFLAFVSHELRSPLNAILGWSKILLTKTVDDPLEGTRFETIERSADCRQSYKRSSGFGSCRVRETAFGISPDELMRSGPRRPISRRSRSLKHTASSLRSCRLRGGHRFADAGRLQQVFTNLISNAIKFTPDGGKVSIALRSTAETVAIHVKDTGQESILRHCPIFSINFRKARSVGVEVNRSRPRPFNCQDSGEKTRRCGQTLSAGTW